MHEITMPITIDTIERYPWISEKLVTTGIAAVIIGNATDAFGLFAADSTICFAPSTKIPIFNPY
jgi:hypothetical protein